MSTAGKERIALQGKHGATWYALEVKHVGAWKCCALAEQSADLEALADDESLPWRIVEVFGEAIVSRGAEVLSSAERDDNRAEAAEERANEAYYGGSVLSERERHAMLAREKHDEERRVFARAELAARGAK